MIMDDTIANMYYLQLPTGGPTQADIWDHLPGRSRGERCCGLVVTPRCDFAHSKSPVLNYLPIIPFEDYLLSAACFPLLEQLRTEAKDVARSKGVALQIDQLFELGMPVVDVLAHALKVEAGRTANSTGKAKRALEEFISACERYDVIAQLLKKSTLTHQEALSAVNVRRWERLQRDLIKNNTSDTYFLPPSPPLIEVPSIVLLRYIYTCPIDLLEDSGKSNESKPLPERLLRLKSPFIESLMSKFAALFTRVGTRDLPDATISEFMIRTK
jgi:hypothetical protein